MSSFIANAELNRVSQNEQGSIGKGVKDAMTAAYYATNRQPTVNDLKVKLMEYVQQGILTPEIAETYLQQATEFENMDPLARNEIVEMVESKGFDPQSKAALQQLQQATGEQERGGREAILQNAAERGVSGSGIEMAANLANQQGSATRLANQGFQAAADANQRQLQAVQGLASMDAQKAAAQDAINQFNSANRIGWAKNAEEKNLAEKQRIADQNVQMKNQEQLYNKQLKQQVYENAVTGAGVIGNASGQSIKANTDLLHERNVGPTGMFNKWSDKRLKTDIEEIDPSAYLESLEPSSYEYKDESFGEGPQVGVMAQDLEKVAPQAVTDTPEGKTIDYEKMGPPMLAALSALAKRVGNLEGGGNA